MKRQYRIIDTGKVDWTIEIYHDGELIATEKFYDADEFDERFDELKKAGYEQGYLPREVQQGKEAYEKKLAKIIKKELNEKPIEEYIKKEDVLKIIYEIKENKDIPKNYGTLIDIIQQIRNLPPEDVVKVKHGKWIPCKNHSGYKCSNCGARIKNSDKLNGNHIWCHKCGAKMDLAKEVEEK